MQARIAESDRARHDVQRKRARRAQLHDPLADLRQVKQEYGIELMTLDDLLPADAVIFAVAHDSFIRGGWPFVTRSLRDGRGLCST